MPAAPVLDDPSLFAQAYIGFDPMLLEPFIVQMVKWQSLGGVGTRPEPPPEWLLKVVNYARQLVTQIMIIEGIPDAEL